MRSGIDALGGFGKIGRGRDHNTLQEFLGITIVKRKPRALYLDLDAMTLEKCVISGVEAEAILERFVCGNGFGMFETLAVPPAEDLRVDDELIAGHVRFRGR